MPLLHGLQPLAPRPYTGRGPGEPGAIRAAQAAQREQNLATMAAAKRDIKALFEAASRGDTKTVEGTKDLDKYKDGRGRSCLHFAAASGSVDCAKRILELAPQLSSQADDDGARRVSDDGRVSV